MSNGRVKSKNKFSKPIKSKYGVLQGGVLSYYQDKQFFFNLEHTTAPLDNIIFFMCLIGPW